jgi:hypothetical protein
MESESLRSYKYLVRALSPFLRLLLMCLPAGKRMVKGEKVAILGHDVFRQSPKARRGYYSYDMTWN